VTLDASSGIRMFTFDVRIDFSAVTTGLIQADFNVQSVVSLTSQDRASADLVVTTLMIVVAVWSAGLRVKALLKAYQHRDAIDRHVTRQSVEREPPVVLGQDVNSGSLGSAEYQKRWYEHVLLADLGQVWHFISILTSIDCITYGTICFVPYWHSKLSEGELALKIILGGIGALLTCVQFLGFFRFFRRIYFFIFATKHMIGAVLKFFGSVLPLFAGFVLFFTILFGPTSSGRFATVSNSALALYCAAFGDNINTSLQVLWASGPTPWRWLAAASLVMYVMIFMSTVFNLVLTIVLERYGELRSHYGVFEFDGDEAQRTAHAAGFLKHRILNDLKELIRLTEATERSE